jgi:hypothetical protein
MKHLRTLNQISNHLIMSWSKSQHQSNLDQNPNLGIRWIWNLLILNVCNLELDYDEFKSLDYCEWMRSLNCWGMPIILTSQSLELLKPTHLPCERIKQDKTYFCIFIRLVMHKRHTHEMFDVIKMMKTIRDLRGKN